MDLAEAPEGCAMPESSDEDVSTTPIACTGEATETTTTWDESYTWVAGSGWVKDLDENGDPVRSNVSSTDKTVDLAEAPEGCTPPPDDTFESEPIEGSICELGVYSSYKEVTTTTYSWVEGQGYVANEPVTERVVIADGEPLANPPADCLPPTTGGEDVSTTPIACTGEATETTTTWDESYTWVGGTGWVKDLDENGDPVRSNVSVSETTVDLAEAPEACTDPSYEEDSSEQTTQCLEGTVTETTTTTRYSYDWVAGSGYVLTSQEQVGTTTDVRPATAEECPDIEPGPTDQCPDLEGEQPEGFPCVKLPTTDTVNSEVFDCTLGYGVRQGTVVTTYEFVDGAWQGTVGETVWEPYSYSELSPEKAAELGCDTVEPPEEICPVGDGVDLVDGVCVKEPEQATTTETTSRTCEGVTTRQGTVTTTYSWDATVGDFVGTTTTVYDEPTTRQLTEAEKAELGCNPVEPPEPIDPVDPTEPTEPTEPTRPTEPTEPTKPVEPGPGPKAGPGDSPTTGPNVGQLPATGSGSLLTGAGILGTLMLMVGAGMTTRRRRPS